MDLQKVEIGIKVIVKKLESTKGFLIADKHLNIREVGKIGVVLQLVAGHGGDVWFVQQDNGIAAYCFTEMELIN